MPIIRYHGRDWYVNMGQKSGAHAENIDNVPDEPSVYLEIWNKKQRHYGVMPNEDIAMFVMFNRHAFEIMPTSRRRKFYMDTTSTCLTPTTLPRSTIEPCSSSRLR